MGYERGSIFQPVTLSIREILMQHERQKCSACGGTGDCPVCKGTGDGGQCERCGGTGRCPNCQGTGRKLEDSRSEAD